jgi:hypothetical protein
MDDFTTTDQLLFRIHGAIEKHGYFTMAVMSTPTTPSWAYTIGFLERGHPELVVVGLSAESAHGFISQAWRDTVDGHPFEPGRQHRRTWSKPGCVDLAFVMLDLPDLQWEFPSDLTSALHTYYRSRGGYPCEPAVRQLVWPDLEGRLPWDEGFDETMRKYQPLLDETRWDHHEQPLDHHMQCGPGCDLWEHRHS